LARAWFQFFAAICGERLSSCSHVVHPPCRPHREERGRKHHVFGSHTTSAAASETAHPVHVVEAERHRDVDAASRNRVDRFTKGA
jgi:hypothetical protein